MPRLSHQLPVEVAETLVVTVDVGPPVEEVVVLTGAEVVVVITVDVVT